MLRHKANTIQTQRRAEAGDSFYYLRFAFKFPGAGTDFLLNGYTLSSAACPWGRPQHATTLLLQIHVANRLGAETIQDSCMAGNPYWPDSFLLECSQKELQIDERSTALLAKCGSKRAPEEEEAQALSFKWFCEAKTKRGAQSPQGQGANVFCVLSLLLHSLRQSLIIQRHSQQRFFFSFLLPFKWPVSASDELYNKICLFLRTAGIGEMDCSSLDRSINRWKLQTNISSKAKRKERAGVS